MRGLIPETEIALDKFEDAVTVAKVLLENEYVVMLSREEDLYIVNFVYAQYADRNDVVFMDRYKYDDCSSEKMCDSDDEEDTQDE